MTFPLGLHAAPRFGARPPAAADVVIIGGGIAGVMTAWFLAARGCRVVLCEKGRIAAEQSSRNWGWVRKQGRDPAEIPRKPASRADAENLPVKLDRAGGV